MDELGDDARETDLKADFRPTFAGGARRVAQSLRSCILGHPDAITGQSGRNHGRRKKVFPGCVFLLTAFAWFGLIAGSENTRPARHVSAAKVDTPVSTTLKHIRIQLIDGLEFTLMCYKCPHVPTHSLRFHANRVTHCYPLMIQRDAKPLRMILTAHTSLMDRSDVRKVLRTTHRHTNKALKGRYGLTVVRAGLAPL